MYGNNEEGITELIPSGPVLQCLSLHREDSHLEVAQVVPGTTIAGRQVSQEVTHGQLLPGGMVESSYPGQGAWNVTTILETT